MSSRFPSGTVTFLFTDVEGSTNLLHSLGPEAYAEELAEHRHLIREACARHHGVEVDTQGDAFFFAFPSAPGALHAAEEMTEALAPGPIRVRIGIHTGAPHLSPDGYVGQDVHRAARIAAAGHGGQVLVSEETRSGLEEDMALVSLGAHRLKDFDGPLTLYQLGEGAFPPLKTIANTNLPTPASSFLGRKEELYQADLLLQQGRLLSVTGPGGAGKTRFALELARRAREERFSDYEDGVFGCFLSSLRDPALVLSTIAQTLSLHEEAGRDALETLVSQLEGKRLLLLLDNLEHLLPCAPELSQLLSGTPGLTLLVTSRELLRLQGELPYALPPLAAEEGVALFCERARAEPSEPIRELCLRLEGLPLALELAAARMRLLSPEQLLERLSQRLDLLKGGRDADPRQQTLRATIEWSYELLAPEEKQLFARLSVFAGGCTLEAAEEVAEADLDTLQSLVEKSLLRFSNERFWMLETIREYAGERLAESGELEQLERTHAVRHARTAVELSPRSHERSAEMLQILREEQENMRAALEFALQRDDVAVAGDLIHGLWFHWLTAGSGREAAAWAHRYLASSRQRLSPLERYAGDVGVAEILRFAGDAETAAMLKHELVAVGRANPDAVIHGIIITRSTAATLSDLAWMELDAGRLEEARVCAEEALAMRRGLGLQHGIAHALLPLAAIAYRESDLTRARELYVEATAIYEAAESQASAIQARLATAECELLLARLDETAHLLLGVISTLSEDSDQSTVVHALRVAGMLAGAREDADRCAALFGAADRRLEESGITLFSQFEDETHRAYLARARTELGEAAFHTAYERCADASDETVWALALGNLD